MNAGSARYTDTIDDVDTLVDALINDPSKADDVKAALRRRISTVRLMEIKANARHVIDTVDDDADDLWDNVPV